MKKRVREWLPMVLIAWRDKLRISLKYLKQFFSALRFHKCLKSRKRVGKVSAGVSGQRGFPDTWSLTHRFSMKQKPI